MLGSFFVFDSLESNCVDFVFLILQLPIDSAKM